MHITVYSFSYRDGGPPLHVTRTNGGGYVFDTRCIPNPVVAQPNLAHYSGENERLRQFFDAETDMQDYLSHVKGLLQLATVRLGQRRPSGHEGDQPWNLLLEALIQSTSLASQRYEI